MDEHLNRKKSLHRTETCGVLLNVLKNRSMNKSLQFRDLIYGVLYT